MANEELVRLLKEEPEKLDEYQEQHPEGLDLQGADLQGVNLRGADLRGANLRGANLQGAQLQGANLQRVNLQEANLEEANLRGADLQGVNLREAQLQGANLQRVNLQEANLQGANLEGAQLQWAKLQGANLEGAQLQWADLQRAYLEGVNLQGVNLRGADLRGADLQGVNLEEVNLQEANLDGVNLEGVNLQKADLQGANLEGVNLQGANLQRANLKGADLQDTNFLEAHLLHTVFHNAKNIINARNLKCDSRELEVCFRVANDTLVGKINYFLRWNNIKTFGQLPLFSTSYFVLIMFPVLTYIRAQINHYISIVIESAKSMEATGSAQLDPVVKEFQEFVITNADHLRLGIPTLSLLLFCATLFLAIASTIYVLFCPSRVKEFSRDQWCDQHKNHPIQYDPYTMRFTVLRWVCSFSYAVGGLLAFIYLAIKIPAAFMIVWKYSSLAGG